MAHVIYPDGVKIPYELRRHPRSRRVTLRVYPDGVVRMSVPPRASEAWIVAGLRKHAAWLRQTWERANAAPRPAAALLTHADYLRHKTVALTLIHERLAALNAAHYSFRWRRVAVRDQRTRWGSCSRLGDLSFNYRLALLPAHLADYVICHELCHLEQFDHSARFWSLVARACPNHRELKKELRDSQLLG